MRRTLSFGKRPGRPARSVSTPGHNADDEDDVDRERSGSQGSSSHKQGKSSRSVGDDEVNDRSEKQSSRLGSLGKKIVRSASFGRKKSAKDREGPRHAPGDANTSERDAEGSPTDDHDDESRSVPAVLNGWLYKRHQHKKGVAAQWARRYFHVDEMRGTLSYAKNEAKKPTVVLPLADVTSVRPAIGKRGQREAWRGGMRRAGPPLARAPRVRRVELGAQRRGRARSARRLWLAHMTCACRSHRR